MNRTLLFSNNSDRSRLKFIPILSEFKELFQVNQAAGGINYLGTNDLEDYIHYMYAKSRSRITHVTTRF